MMLAFTTKLVGTATSIKNHNANGEFHDKSKSCRVRRLA